MRIGVVADGFTGAGDVACALTRGGLPTLLALGDLAPALPTTGGAAVVGLKIRTAPPQDAIRGVLAAAKTPRIAGAGHILYKRCSTFDSTPRGNIGPVAEALKGELGEAGSVIVCPAYPGAGRTVHMAHLFVGDRLLSRSAPKDHPLTPMFTPEITPPSNVHHFRDTTQQNP